MENSCDQRDQAAPPRPRRHTPITTMSAPPYCGSGVHYWSRLQSTLRPCEDGAVALEVDDAPRPGNRRMIRRRLGHRQPQKSAYRQRVARAPGDPAFRVDPFEQELLGSSRAPELSSWPLPTRLPPQGLRFRLRPWCFFISHRQMRSPTLENSHPAI